MSLQESFRNERAWRKGPGIPEGSDVEKAALGLPEILKKDRIDGYLPFDRAIAYVKEHQPNPLGRSHIVSELRSKIAALSTDRNTPVKFYTAVGTPLDVYHGVDAFFEQGGRIVTVDISMLEKDEHKADALLHATLDDDGKPQIDAREIDRVAKIVADSFNKGGLRRAA